MSNRFRTRTAFSLGFALAVGLLVSLGFSLISGNTDGGTRPSSDHAITRPARDSLGVLDRPSQLGDRLPAAIEAELGELTAAPAGASESLRPGEPLGAQARLAMSGAGSKDANVYVVPTTKERVCLVIVGGISGCSNGFSRATPVESAIYDADGVGRGEGTVFAGLAPDTVRSVEVDFGDTQTTARLMNNVYFLELDDSNDQFPKRLIVHEKGGQVTTMEIPNLADLP
jgi:hypothetical protein